MGATLSFRWFRNLFCLVGVLFGGNFSPFGPKCNFQWIELYPLTRISSPTGNDYDDENNTIVINHIFICNAESHWPFRPVVRNCWWRREGGDGGQSTEDGDWTGVDLPKFWWTSFSCQTCAVTGMQRKHEDESLAHLKSTFVVYSVGCALQIYAL